MTPIEFLEAARCPESLGPCSSGLWTITKRRAKSKIEEAAIGWKTQTVLMRTTLATLHIENGGDVVMEDSILELCRHLPIWMAARGRVLVTGLGLGCVVRGLLANHEVERVTVIEVDSWIIAKVWPEFQRDTRAMILQGDALTYEFPPGVQFDFAWHDLWTETGKLATMHAEAMIRYRPIVGRQGAWGFPRIGKRLLRREGWFLEARQPEC